jgi:hypothetical protein
MSQELLNSFEEKGLACPFIAGRSGDVIIASSGESMKNEIAQMSTVIFETIGAVGDIAIDRIEILADVKGLAIAFDQKNLLGSLFDRSSGTAIDNIWTELEKLKEQSGGIAAIEKEEVKPAVEEKIEEKVAEIPVEKPKKPEEKPKVKIDAGVLDTIRDSMKDFLGDFTERIFNNQLKAQRIKTDELYDTDVRRLIFALGKAAGMIIGPSKGHTMTNKLLGLLK